MKTFILSSLLLFSIAHSQANISQRALVKSNDATTEKYCKNVNSNLIQRVPLQGHVGYFAKSFVHNGKTYFTLKVNYEAILIDSKGNKIAGNLGYQDPIATPDGKILTVLVINKENRYEVKFYDIQKLIDGKSKDDAEIETKGVNVYGAYQSLAAIKTNGSETTYRMVIDEAVYSSDDKSDNTTHSAPIIYELTRNGNSIKHNKVTEPNPCKDERLQMPFLSKKGNLLAALNLKTQTTQVFDISDGKCQFKHDLGVYTGKADFSYDDKKIAFHLAAKPMLGAQGWVGNMGTDNSSNVFVYDLDSKKITQITKNQNRNSYYPTYLPDNTLMHIDSDDIPGTLKSKYRLGISTSQPETTTVIKAPEACNCHKPELLAAKFAIGQLLFGLCTDAAVLTESPKDYESTYFTFKAGEVTEAECIDIVTKFWNQEFQKTMLEKTKTKFSAKINSSLVAKLKKEDLLTACKH